MVGGEGGRALTCQVKGMFLMFTNASVRNRILKMVLQVGGPLVVAWRSVVESLLSAAMTIVSVSAVAGCVEFIVESSGGRMLVPRLYL